MTSFASVCIPVFDEPDVLRSFSCSNRGFVWRVDGYLHISQLQWFKDSLSGLRVPRSYSIIRSSIHDHSSISIPAWMSWGTGCQLRVKVRWTETIDFAYMVRTCVILVRYTAICMQSRRLATKCPSLLLVRGHHPSPIRTCFPLHDSSCPRLRRWCSSRSPPYATDL
jgi:hypothetical protein